MKILPSTRRDWLALASVPFKAYVIGVALIYPYWSLHMPGRPGMIDSGSTTDGMTCLSSGCFISFAALVVVAIFQMSAKDRRRAAWSILFALVAFCAGMMLIPPTLR